MAQLPEGIDVQKLLHLHEVYQKQLQKKKEFYQTPEGKAANCAKAKKFYEANKERILAKAAEKRAAGDGANSLDYYYQHREEILAKAKEKRAAKKAAEAAAVRARAGFVFSPPAASSVHPPVEPLQE